MAADREIKASELQEGMEVHGLGVMEEDAEILPNGRVKIWVWEQERFLDADKVVTVTG